jgi:hypothetical protein
MFYQIGLVIKRQQQQNGGKKESSSYFLLGTCGVFNKIEHTKKS